MSNKIDMSVKKIQSIVKLFEAAVVEFPNNKREESLFGEWSLKDILAHISGWNIARIEEVDMLFEGKEIPFIEDFDEFNRQSILDRRSCNWDHIHEEFIRTSKDLISAFNKIPASLVNKKIWQGKEFTPSKWMDIDIEHLEEHLAEIKEVSNRF